MKKISIFLLLAFVSSCSSSPDNSSNNSSSNSNINPPSWIQGTWIQDGGTGGYKFTSNDFILVGSSSQTSFANAVTQTKATGGNASVIETITSNSYNIDITIGIRTDSYYFNKITTTKIEWINDPLGNLADLFYIKQ